MPVLYLVLLSISHENLPPVSLFYENGPLRNLLVESSHHLAEFPEDLSKRNESFGTE